ncbi:MAG: J domain-containing protein [Hyphomicrobiaceae bacterium]|nr:J domain-containing protein [Hyphomicrobiaceae bacterium]
MAAADITAWRRQNSDVVKVEIVLADGSTLRGSVLKPRDKQLREVFNLTQELFIEFECNLRGTTILSKTAIREVHPETEQSAVDEESIEKFGRRQAVLDKTDPYQILGVTQSVTAEGLHKAYITRARLYHPDRFGELELPEEVSTYMNAMARRVNGAFAELNALLKRQGAA